MAEGTRLELSLTQIVASALAAVSAAVAASFVGVYGTIVGAAVVSVVSTAGAALYQHSMDRTRARIRRSREGGYPTMVESSKLRILAGQLRGQATRASWWKAVGAVSLLVFAIAIGVVTTIELSANRSMPDLVAGRHNDGATTSLAGALTRSGDAQRDGTTTGGGAEPGQPTGENGFPGGQDDTERSGEDTRIPRQEEPTEAPDSVEPTPDERQVSPDASDTPTSEPDESEPTPEPEPSVDESDEGYEEQEGQSEAPVEPDSPDEVVPQQESTSEDALRSVAPS